jgi:hypothetical protein
MRSLLLEMRGDVGSGGGESHGVVAGAQRSPGCARD